MRLNYGLTRGSRKRVFENTPEPQHAIVAVSLDKFSFSGTAALCPTVLNSLIANRTRYNNLLLSLLIGIILEAVGQ